MSSRPEESPPRALPKPCVNLSIHTAPDGRPVPHKPPASPRPRAPPVAIMASVGPWPRLNNAAPSVQPHYRAFIPTTSCSAPVLRFGTLVLAVWAAWTSPLASERQVLTFRTRAWLSFAPPTFRMPLGQASGFSRADPGGRDTPRFRHRLIRFRHFIDGSLALASLNLACRDQVPAFPQRSPPSLLSTAARGGLRPAPDCRPRRALLHLSYSSASLHADGAFVPHDPNRTLLRHHRRSKA